MNAQPAILSIGVLATFALAAGGGWLLMKRRDRTRATLMIVAAIVLLANVLLWALPVPARAAEALPGDVRTYDARRAACVSHKSRAGAAATRGYPAHCYGLPEERRRLRMRYRGNPQILRALTLDALP